MNFPNIKDKYSLVVQDDDNNIRIDKFLANFLPSLSRSKIQKYIKDGYAVVNSKTVTEIKYKLGTDDQVQLSVPESPALDIEPKEQNFLVVYEDEHLAVIDKPAGLTVHPGSGTGEDTLVHGMLACFDTLSDVAGPERPGIVHRIDKNTSGLMIIAKDNETHLKLSDMLKDKTIERKYKAVILGMLKPPSGHIDKNIARSRKDRKKMGVVTTGGKTAITHYDTIEIFQNGLASEVECKLETGRTHQIRVHFSHIGHPILGDPEYGNFRSYKFQSLSKEVIEYLKEFNRQALHSYSLEFVHPITNENLSFKSDLPDDIVVLLDKLRQKNA